MDKRKIICNLVVLGSVLASMVLAFTLFGKDIRASHAQSPGVTVTDFWLNGGQEPWGRNPGESLLIARAMCG